MQFIDKKLKAKALGKQFPRWERVEAPPRKSCVIRHLTTWALFSTSGDIIGIIERMSGHWRYSVKDIVGFEAKRDVAMTKVEEELNRLSG